ncbi:MAG: hypothetical protein ABSC13_09155 [Dehalococcoidia bacterium]|jgi:tetratricopeptide (TPR) repeat protein
METQGENRASGRLDAAVSAFAAAHDELYAGIENETKVENLVRLAWDKYSQVDISMPLLQRVLELEPDNIEALTMLGRLAWLLADHVAAYGYVERAKRVAPDDRSVLMQEAFLSQDWDQRLSLYRRVLELYPDAEDARKNVQIMLETTDEGKRRSMLAWPPGQHPPDRPCL